MRMLDHCWGAMIRSAIEIEPEAARGRAASCRVRLPLRTPRRDGAPPQSVAEQCAGCGHL